MTTDGGIIPNLSCGYELVHAPLGFPSGPCDAEVYNQTRHPGWSILKNNLKHMCGKTYDKTELTNRGGVYPSDQELLDKKDSERMNFESMLPGAMDENRWRYGFGMPGELIG